MLSSPSSSPTRSSPAHEGPHDHGRPRAPAAHSEPQLDQGVRLAYETELHKLMAQLTTPS